MKLLCSVVREAFAVDVAVKEVEASAVRPTAAVAALAVTVKVLVGFAANWRWPLLSVVAVTAPAAPRPETALKVAMIVAAVSVAAIATV